MAELTRRGLLGAMGAAGACALAGCGKYPGPETLEPLPSGWNRGEERWVATSCGQCPAGCGIRVRVIEGRAVKIEGNPGHPINRGGIGPKGQSGLQVLYHPDRITGPMRRSGPRGAGKWEPISWDEAIREVAARLGDLRTRGEPQSLVVLDGEPRGMMPQLWDRFLKAYGSPNHLDHVSTAYGGKLLAMSYMHGVAELPAYDWKETRYVLGFGASLFESWCQTIHLTRASGHMRRGTPGQRGKFVQVSPRFSVTAAKSDEWVPIEPATYGALALGIAHVLVAKDLFDKDFVRDHTFGFEDWKDAQGRAHRGFRDLLLKDYPPEKVSKITSVPVETIERLAHEMASHRPAIALADGGAAAATNGLGTAMAIHALNGLLGNLERPGGMLVQRRAPLAPWKEVAADEGALKGRSAPRLDGAGTRAVPLAHGFVQGAPEAILANIPYPVKALFLYRSNPVFSKPDGNRWAEALRKVPFVVSFSPLADESTRGADLVLPDHTYLERWEIVEPVPSVGHPLLGLRQPVVTPLYNTLSTGDAVIRLAKAMGPAMGAAFPWADYRTAMEERLQGVLQAGNGSVSASKLSVLIEKAQPASGWWAAGYPFEQWDKAFATPSGKFEFYSQTIATKLAETFPDERSMEAHLVAHGVVTRGDDLCLPHWEPSRLSGDPGAHPFVLVPYRGINYAEGGVRHLSWLREMPSAGFRAWKERVDLHPEDARRLGVGEGDLVRVESTAGKSTLCVRLEKGVRPGTAGLPLGLGPWPPAPEDEGTTGGYNLLANLSDPLAGIFALQGTRVRISKEGA